MDKLAYTSYFLLFSLFVHANVASIKGDVKTSKLFENFQNKLSQQNHRLVNIRGTLSTMEKSLGKNNETLLKNIKRRHELGKNIDELSEDLDKSKQVIGLEYQKVKKIFQKFLINSWDEWEGSVQIYEKQVLTAAFRDKLNKFKDQLEEVKLLQENLSQLQAQHQRILQIESSLSELMNDLELKKKKLAEQYLHEMEVKESIQESVEGLKGKLAIERRRARKAKLKQQMAADLKRKKLIKDSERSLGHLSAPLGKYAKFEYGKKGVTFKFKQTSEVRAVAAGEVVYSGNVASLGNVIMIDHGHQLRSITLGEFSPKIKKGKKVKKGELVGYTRSSLEQYGSLYFEMRKKNVAENTILWFDRKKL